MAIRLHALVSPFLSESDFYLAFCAIATAAGSIEAGHLRSKLTSGSMADKPGEYPKLDAPAVLALLDDANMEVEDAQLRGKPHVEFHWSLGAWTLEYKPNDAVEISLCVSIDNEGLCPLGTELAVYAETEEDILRLGEAAAQYIRWWDAMWWSDITSKDSEHVGADLSLEDAVRLAVEKGKKYQH